MRVCDAPFAGWCQVKAWRSGRSTERSLRRCWLRDYLPPRPLGVLGVLILRCFSRFSSARAAVLFNDGFWADVG